MTADKGNFNRIKHSAYIVVGIKGNYQGQGIGTALFKQLERWAVESNITRLELTVVASNEGAVHLYKKCGFEIEGVKRNAMIIDGKYVDEFYMAKLLEQVSII